MDASWVIDRRWRFLGIAVLVVGLLVGGCTDPSHGNAESGATIGLIPADKALVSISYSRGGVALSGAAQSSGFPVGCTAAYPETHVVTYLSYLVRDTVLIDTVATTGSTAFENVLFAPAGDAWLYVISLHVPDDGPGVVLAGTRLEQPVSFVGGEAKQLEVDLDTLAYVVLEWADPADLEHPWTGGPMEYSFEPFGESSEVGIQMRAVLPWPMDDSRAPGFGWENVVSFSANNPTGEYYMFEVWEADDVLARNLVSDSRDSGQFGVRVNGLGFNGASFAFPTRQFYTLDATCTPDHTFQVPARPER